MKEYEKNNPEENQAPYDTERWQKEPYKSEWPLKQAIQTWEDHSRQIIELQFFWWCGFLCAIVGGVCYLRIHRWFELSLLLLGFLEMLWATCPAFRIFGNEVEFERLLIWKIVYSVATMALVLGAWYYMVRNSMKPDST